VTQVIATDGHMTLRFGEILKSSLFCLPTFVLCDVIGTLPLAIVFGRPLQLTVRPMLRDRCLSCLSVCLPITLGYC